MEIARPAALVILLLVTGVGVYKFATGDWTDVIDYWGNHLSVIPLLVGFAILDVILESMAWMWSYGRLKIRAFDKDAAMIYLAGNICATNPTPVILK